MSLLTHEQRLAPSGEPLSLLQLRSTAASPRAPAAPVGAPAAPARAPAAPVRAPEGIRGRRLVDSHGRTIRDLRLSVTDKCNFRCIYCMDESATFAPKEDLLSVREFARLARIAGALGIRKIRLTGGEPTLHPLLDEIVACIRRESGAAIALITNGSLLTPARLAALRVAGLGRITISIDSLRADRFAAITRSRCSPESVTDSIAMALEAGLTPVKANAVLIRGVNDDEAVDLAALARRFAIEMRFIEYMPLDSGGEWDSSRWVSAAETRLAIEQRFPLRQLASEDPASTARVYEFADGAPGRIGFIAPISSPFCGACSRLRITADGMIRPCLFSHDEWDLRSVMRAGASDRAVAEFLTDAAWNKQAGHGITEDGFRQPTRTMSAIGG